MMAKHGDVISFNEIKSRFPIRRDFLNPDLVAADVEAINSKKTIQFLPNDVQEMTTNEGNYQFYTYVVCAGITPSGLKTTVAIKTKPFFYIRIPDEYISLDMLNEDSDVHIDTWAKCENFKNEVIAALKANDIIKPTHAHLQQQWEIVRAYQAKTFQTCRGFYIKCVFNTCGYRKKAINLLSYEAKGYAALQICGYFCHTAIDDLTCYYRVISRIKRIALCNWNHVANYEIAYAPGGNRRENIFGEFNGDYLLIVDENDVHELNKTELANIPKHMLVDRMIEMTWDIEAYRAANDAELPNPREPGDEMFMIGLTFGFYSEKHPLMRVCIVNKPCDALPNDLTIVCDDVIKSDGTKISGESLLVCAFAMIVGAIQPEFLIGFNDGDFDYEFYAERALRYDLLEFVKASMSNIYIQTFLTEDDDKKAIKLATAEGITIDLACTKIRNRRILGSLHYNKSAVSSWNAKGGGLHFQKSVLKLDAETPGVIWQLAFFGMIPIDARAMFRIIYRNPEKSSLNFFLTDNKLNMKEDMKISELFAIYGRTLESREAAHAESANMAEIKRYCVRDAEACHDLIKTRNVISDRRMVSAIAYTSMVDAIKRADGIKVQNLTNMRAFERDIMFSNLSTGSKSSMKYPGAHVVPPKKKMYKTKHSLRDLREAIQQNIRYYDEFSFDDQKTELAKKYANPIDYSTILNEYGAYDYSLDYRTYNYDFSDEMLDIIEKYFSKNKYKLIRSAVLSNNFNHVKSYLGEMYYNWVECGSFKMSDFIAVAIWVLGPNEWPVTGLDFASLYPSLMMAYNLSIEKLIPKDYKDPEGSENLAKKAKALEDRGYKTHYINFQYGENMIEAYSVRHTYDGTGDMEEHGFGIFPSILLWLKNERKLIKKELARANDFLEEADKKIADILEADEPDAKARVEAIVSSSEYNDAQFNSAYYDSKQKAVKVFMNTFYGVTGNEISPLYMLELAGGITSNGQYNLKLIIKTIEEYGARVCYGDTDSAYVQLPEIIYLDEANKYYSGECTRLEFWTRVVEITFTEIHELNTKVNETLYADNGTKFLATAYEEVLWPVALLAKKKYVGIPHENVPNFRPRKLFIRGIDVKKRGMPEIMKKVINDVMWVAMDYETLYTFRELVEKCIHTMFSTEWSPAHFRTPKSYKPLKKNITINNFVARMKEERSIIIPPIDRFDVVYVKRPPFYHDTSGKIVRLKMADFMELADIAETENMEINIMHYFKSFVAGQLARFITYDSEFMHSNKSSYGEMEKDHLEHARKWVESIGFQYSEDHVNHGREYKKLYKCIKKQVDSKLDVQNGNCSAAIDLVGKSPADILRELHSECEGDAKAWAINVIEYRKRAGTTFESLYKEYVLSEESDVELQCIGECLTTLKKHIDTKKEVFNSREEAIETMTKVFREKLAAGGDSEDVCAEVEHFNVKPTSNLTDEDIEEVEKAITKIRTLVKIKIRNDRIKTILINEHRASAHLAPVDLDFESLTNQFAAENTPEEYLIDTGYV